MKRKVRGAKSRTDDRWGGETIIKLKEYKKQFWRNVYDMGRVREEEERGGPRYKWKGAKWKTKKVKRIWVWAY